ncbi:MAG: type III-B CRISPR module RAMP protein Cmr6 [Tannerella sp.]|uniref:type III-B CRISPR module RAMP protein Cmr6 n=1 Tax=Tannerella sp. TaxID=2382127 RepID=UPI003FA294AA
MRNLGKFYYKDYFEGVDFHYLLLEEDIKREQSEDRKRTLERQLDSIKDNNETKIKGKNKILSDASLSTINSVGSVQTDSFSLKIAYPGLVTGIGINHEAKIEGEFKLGVHFDYTWGMPVVYGSSVKGVLRSAFKDEYVDKKLVESANNKWKEKEKIADSMLIPQWIGEADNFKKIIDDVFEGKGKSIYNRDIFFDAVIVKADKKGRILCSDSITPHGDNPLKNPTPLTFLKIAPGCTMEFRFKLVDSKIDGKVFTAAQKKALFEEIIKTVGIGAKTNVGYGQFQ